MVNSNHSARLVSVVIPTFNRANFLSKAIESILNQKYPGLEVIIVDDGSSDNTEEVVNSLQKEYSNIFYYHNERSKGPSGARNTGILRSSGEYIAFLDSDDIWLDDHLKNGLEILNGHPEIDIIFGNFGVVDFHSGRNYYNFFDQKRILHTLKSVRFSPGIKVLHDNLFIALIQENFFHISSTILRKSSINAILFDESIMFSEDRDFAIKLYKEAEATFAFSEDPVFIAYKHGSNIYNTGDRDSKSVIEAHLCLFTRYLKIYNLSNDEKRILNKLIAKKLSSISYLNSKNKEYQNAFSFILKSFKYGLTLTQIKDLMKVLVTLFLGSIPKKFYNRMKDSRSQEVKYK